MSIAQPNLAFEADGIPSAHPWRRWIALSMLVVLVLGDAALAAHPKLDKLPALLHNPRVHVIASTAELPPWILKRCQDDKGRIAEPGADWDATDVWRGLPRARLQWAVTDGLRYIVQCERGGFGYFVDAFDAGPKPGRFRRVPEFPDGCVLSPEALSAYLIHVAPELAGTGYTARLASFKCRAR